MFSNSIEQLINKHSFQERQFLNITNYIFTVIFTVEMMTKVIASGLICGAGTYLHTGWNVMDGFLVIISIVDLATMNRGAMMNAPTTTATAESDATTRIFSMLRVFRLLRTLRPLRGTMKFNWNIDSFFSV